MAPSHLTPAHGEHADAAKAEARAGAQLLIHAAGDTPARDGVLERLLMLLRGLMSDGRQRQAPPGTSLRIADLQGRPCFAADNTLTLVAVHLPAGTYHVSARLGAVERRYTLTLERGATVDLYLRLPGKSH